MNETPETRSQSPEVHLLISTQCQYCKIMLGLLADLVKEGSVGQLTVSNLDKLPQLASELGVCSVPCLIAGGEMLAGNRSREEVLNWLERENSVDGMVLQLNELLTSGGLERALALVEKQPRYFDAIMKILSNPEAKINVRVRIGVIMEHHQGGKVLQNLVPALSELATHSSAAIRSDAAHYLSLTESPEVIDVLRGLLNDDSEEVREIAADGIEALSA